MSLINIIIIIPHINCINSIPTHTIKCSHLSALCLYFCFCNYHHSLSVYGHCCLCLVNWCLYATNPTSPINGIPRRNIPFHQWIHGRGPITTLFPTAKFTRWASWALAFHAPPRRGPSMNLGLRGSDEHTIEFDNYNEAYGHVTDSMWPLSGWAVHEFRAAGSKKRRRINQL